MTTIDRLFAQTRNFGRGGRARTFADDGIGAVQAFDIADSKNLAGQAGAIVGRPSQGAAGFDAAAARVEFARSAAPVPGREAAIAPAFAGALAAPVTPSDPLFAQQWHFGKIGDIQTIWEEFTGAGVHVGIYDTGIEVSHPDLVANHDSTRLFSYNGTTYGDGIPSGTESDPQFHGTSVAGLISAANNGTGGVGVAYGSTFTGINIFDDNTPISTDAGFVASLHSLAFDVANNSWNYSDRYRSYLNPTISTSIGAQIIGAWSDVAANGRGGLGTVVVKSAGNDAWNANATGDALDRFSIKVAAVGSADTAASYSSHGANILISAPGSEATSNGGLGIVTTDRTGTAGYNQRGDTAGSYDYTNDFGGTSAAAPIVSGVATLMLDANPNLGWRDVQNILALSATHTGSAYDATTPDTYEMGTWDFNGADNWNGGGLHYHLSYGFGMVNAYNAVRMAEAWSLFGPAQTSANEQSVVVTTAPALAIADPSGSNAFATTDTTFTVTTDLRLENLNLTLDLQHSAFRQLQIVVISPAGNSYFVEDQTGNAGIAGFNGKWEYTVAGLHEQSSLGVWTVRIFDTAAGGTGTLRGVTASFTGSAASIDDVYHYTDEFLSVAAIDAGRSVLHDTNGGTDWLDLSAVTGRISMSQSNGATFVTVNDQQWFSVAADSVIENVVAGDGDDSLQGNDAANALYGMRGNDLLVGLGGDDRLYGGVGDDLFFEDAGNDLVDGGDGTDTLYYSGALAAVTVSLAIAGPQNTGGAGIDTLTGVEWLVGTGFDDRLTGDTHDNLLDGGAGNDTLEGGGGLDQLYGQAGNDLLLSGAGDDFLDGGADTDTASYARATAAVTVSLALTAQNTGGAGFDTFRSIENLTGSAFDDTLSGNTGDNVIDGGAGIDTMSYAAITFRVVIDLAITGQQNTVGGGLDTLLNIENVVGTGYSDELTGNGAANTLTGGDGKDILFGAGGGDRLFGGNDDDTLTGRTNNDWIDGGAGFDTAIYTASKTAVTVDLALAGAQFTGSEGTDTLISIEAVRGGAFGDTLYGNGEANALYGNSGNDRLDGRGGIDKMYGGAGDDVIVIANAGDLAVEKANEGTDTAEAYVSYTLRDNVENLLLLGPAENGSGNALANTITGNVLDNSLRGYAGIDTLFGGGGADRLDGGDGNDFLVGGVDRDTLTGGAGADSFVFDDGDSGTTARVADIIADFSSADGDRIDLRAIDAIAASPADDGFTWIDTAAFSRHAGELRYFQQNGATYLQGDTNGDARPDFVIRIDGLHALTQGDLVF